MTDTTPGRDVYSQGRRGMTGTWGVICGSETKEVCIHFSHCICPARAVPIRRSWALMQSAPCRVLPFVGADQLAVVRGRQ